MPRTEQGFFVLCDADDGALEDQAPVVDDKAAPNAAGPDEEETFSVAGPSTSPDYLWSYGSARAQGEVRPGLAGGYDFSTLTRFPVDEGTGHAEGTMAHEQQLPVPSLGDGRPAAAADTTPNAAAADTTPGARAADSLDFDVDVRRDSTCRDDEVRLGRYRRDATTASRLAKALLLALAATFGMMLALGDVRTYFNGRQRQGKVYLEQPRGGPPGLRHGAFAEAIDQPFGNEWTTLGSTPTSLVGPGTCAR